MEILRKNQKEMPERKKKRKKENSVMKLKNVFDGLISRLDMDEETISELEDTSAEFWKTEKQGEQRLKK